MSTKSNNSKKKASKKNPKKIKTKYEEKLVINGSFEELIKELVTPQKSIKPN